MSEVSWQSEHAEQIFCMKHKTSHETSSPATYISWEHQAKAWCICSFACNGHMFSLLSMTRMEKKFQSLYRLPNAQSFKMSTSNFCSTLVVAFPPKGNTVQHHLPLFSLFLKFSFQNIDNSTTESSHEYLEIQAEMITQTIKANLRKEEHPFQLPCEEEHSVSHPFWSSPYLLHLNQWTNSLLSLQNHPHPPRTVEESSHPISI